MKWIIVLIFLFVSVFAQAAEKPLLTLEVLQQEFAGRAPENVAAKARIQAARAQATSEARFAAPEVSLMWDDIPRGSGFSDAGRLNYRVTQRFGFPLKQIFAVQAANEEAKQVTAEEHMKLNQALAGFQRAYFQWIDTHLELKLNRELQQTLSALLKQGAARYAQNTQSLDEPLEFSLELGTLKNEENELQAKQVSAGVGLQALNGIDLTQYRLPEKFPPLTQVPSEEKVANALAATPWVHMKNSAVALLQKNQQKNQAAFFPDFMLGAEYQDRKIGQDAWSFELGLSIPFAPWSNAFAKERASRKLAQAEKASRLADQQYFLRDLISLRAQMQAHHDAAHRAQAQLLPQARLLLRTATTQYGLNKASLADVLRAYKLYRDAAEQSYEHTYQFWLSQTELEASLGKSLEDL